MTYVNNQNFILWIFRNPSHLRCDPRVVCSGWFTVMKQRPYRRLGLCQIAGLSDKLTCFGKWDASTRYVIDRELQEQANGCGTKFDKH